MHIGDRMMEICLIRHGETAENRKGAYLGLKSDVPLSEEGEAKLKSLILPAQYFSRVFTGPLQRCRQTAALLFPGRELTVLEGMTEIDFGRWEGKTYKELNGDPAYQAWIDSGGSMTFPGGEEREAFVKRTMKAFYELLDGMPEGGSAALICHGGNIMAIMSRLTSGEYFDYQTPCGTGYRLKFVYEGGRIHDLSSDSLHAGLSS